MRAIPIKTYKFKKGINVLPMMPHWEVRLTLMKNNAITLFQTTALNSLNIESYSIMFDMNKLPPV